MVAVACVAAWRAAGPLAKMTATGSWASSAARAGEALGVPRRVALLDREVLVRYIAEVLQPLQECLPVGSRRRPNPQDPEARGLRHLLGHGGERHYQDAKGKRDHDADSVEIPEGLMP